MKKGLGNISGIFFRSTLLGGVIVGFLAISTISIQLPHYSSVYGTVEQATSEEEAEDQPVLKAFEAIPSTAAQITLDHQYLLINVLPELVEEEQETIPNHLAESAGSKVLKILFQRIISPNAP